MRLSAFRWMLGWVVAVVAGCATVDTSVTLLDQTQTFAPTSHAAILYEFPPQPYRRIALIEVTGRVGGTEGELLEEARKRAAAVGADAVVRLEVTSVYQPPVLVYDPFYADPFYWRYRYPYRGNYFPGYYYPPSAFSPFPRNEYRWVGGGDIKNLKAVAIRFANHAPAPSGAAAQPGK